MFNGYMVCLVLVCLPLFRKKKCTSVGKDVSSFGHTINVFIMQFSCALQTSSDAFGVHYLIGTRTGVVKGSAGKTGHRQATSSGIFYAFASLSSAESRLFVAAAGPF